jgi:5-methylcytosine-specific restriction endonuclease McrA
MEIIGYDDSLKKKATCRHCTAIIAYVRADVMEEAHTDYGGGSDLYHYIICPNCKSKVGTGG